MLHGAVNEYWVLCTVDKSCTVDWPQALVSITGQKFTGCPVPPELAAAAEKEMKIANIIEKKVI